MRGLSHDGRDLQIISSEPVLSHVHFRCESDGHLCRGRNDPDVAGREAGGKLSRDGRLFRCGLVETATAISANYPRCARTRITDRGRDRERESWRITGATNV